MNESATSLASPIEFSLSSPFFQIFLLLLLQVEETKRKDRETGYRQTDRAQKPNFLFIIIIQYNKSI